MIKLSCLTILTLLFINLHSQTYKIYGVTNKGGEHNGGVIYSMNLDGSNKQVEYNFDFIDISTPWRTSLIEVDSSEIYGTSLEGGFYNSGTLFKHNYQTGTTKVLHNFFLYDSIGHSPMGDLIMINKTIYGTTTDGNSNNRKGSIFAYDIVKDSIYLVKNLHDSIKANGVSGLIQTSNGKIYGTGQKSLYEYDQALDSIIVIATTDYYQLSTPIELNNGNLLGTGNLGGMDAIIYEYDISLDSLIILNYFTPQIHGINVSKLTANQDLTKFYCTTDIFKSAILEYDYASNTLDTIFTFQNNNVGAHPNEVAFIDSTTLIGNTYSGGANGDGTVYKFNIQTKIHTKLFDLSRYSTGSFPSTKVLKATNNKYYFNTSNGGDYLSSYKDGTLIEINQGLDTLTIKADYGASFNGSNPVNNIYYSGSSIKGFTYNRGNKFSFDVRSKNFSSNYHAIWGSDLDIVSRLKNGFAKISRGAYPNFTSQIEIFDTTGTLLKSNTFGKHIVGELLEHSNGKFYACALQGGNNNLGIIFEYDTSSSTTTILHHFNSSSLAGNEPLSYLIEDTNQDLIGITTSGGTLGSGSIFRLNIQNNIITAEINNPSNTGYGKLYGISKYNDSIVLGAYNRNFKFYLFQYNLNTQNFNLLDSTLHSGNTDFPNPPIVGPDSNIYLCLQNGGGMYTSGSVLKYEVASDTLFEITNFRSNSYIEGAFPSGIIFVKDQSTSIKEKYDIKPISKIYPNPSNNHFVIENPHLIRSIRVYSTSAQLVYAKHNINSVKFSLNAINQDGLYLIQIITEEGIEVQKIIKK